MTKKIEKQNIINDEDIRIVKLLNYEIDKLDSKLEGFSKKYNIPIDKILEVIHGCEPNKQNRNR